MKILLVAAMLVIGGPTADVFQPFDPFVLRQFHVEGFVNQYVIDPIDAGGKTIVANTETIENIPEGWRARETHRLLGADDEEVFELAEPGKPFEEYSRARLKRKK